ncbi:hypothetical protein [Noviherbaspirillum aridicola]|uniref:Histone H1/5 n=1 Tax=Noviherbaspirillum aridicola TaxID=2849687 RepID=A0ABQ4Q9U5_9BURK|nr:hypothetical protein [Noviherbaspirillum aridicola]GIZ54001.1 hypothetical protein NCCP691_40150 [Noviherbaspirillum aridicola]
MAKTIASKAESATPAAGKAAPAAKKVSKVTAQAKAPAAVPAEQAAPAAKPAAKPVEKPAAKPAARKAAAVKAKPEVKAEPEVRARKPKLVRDSFTMPESEYAALGEIKKACLKAGIEVKKSELLRAGVALLKRLDVQGVRDVLGSLPSLKAGRPKKGKQEGKQEGK